MVVTRQSNHRDAAEGEGEISSISQVIRESSVETPLQVPFVFQQPTAMNNGEEFDIAEDAESVPGESETKDTASELTFPVDSDDPPTPSRGGSEVVRLLSSLHDLSRQMEVTMEDLRAQLGNRLGADYGYNSGDYSSMTSGLQPETTTRQRLEKMKGVVKKTCSGVACRLLLLWQLLAVRFPNVNWVTNKVPEAFRYLRPHLRILGYLIVALIAYNVYQTHHRLTQRRVSWI